MTTSSFSSSADFANAQLPKLTPLVNSFAVDDVEAQTKQLFLDLFAGFSLNGNPTLASDCFDANVLGMAHLGTLALVQRFINFDGLVVLGQPAYAEDAARYVYRAWKQRAKRGRGLFFLKTYLQCLFPGAWTVDQQMQLISGTYPHNLQPRDTYGDNPNYFLTSRIKITLDAALTPDVSGLVPIISAIIPARFVPDLSTTLYATSEGGATYRCAATGNPSLTLYTSGSINLPPASARYVYAAAGNPSQTLVTNGTAS